VNQPLYRLLYPLLAAVGLLALLAAILPAQAQTTPMDFDETSAYAPASLTANAPLTQTQPGPRYGHTLTRVGDAIYLFGGMDAAEQGAVGRMPMADVLHDLWAFDLGNNHWRELTPQGDAPAPRFGHAACASNDKLFVQGGLGALAEFGDQWYYDPVSNTWQIIVPDNQGPNPLVGHAAIPDAGGAPVLFGGASLGGTYMDTRVWRYNPVSNRYSMLKEEYNDALKRRWHYMGSVPGSRRFLIFAGIGADGEPLADMWLFDLETRTWTQEWPRLGLFVLSADGMSIRETAVVSPTARAEVAGVIYGNRFLVLGGVDESGAELDEVWEYDLATHSWRALLPLPAPRRQAAAAILEEREDQVDVLVFGGISGGEVISDTLVYTVDIPPTYTVYLPLAMRQ
jgi:hypothetical protein